VARKKSPTVTEAEYRLMDVLWRCGGASVSEVVELLGEPQPAYNTVLTVLRVLERKGYVRHRESGRAFIYRAAIERSAARQQVVQHVVSRFFNGSPGELVLNLLESERVDDDELARLGEILDIARAQRTAQP
jgi:predicted transcriptional regulator